MGLRNHLGHALSLALSSWTPAPASRCLDTSLSSLLIILWKVSYYTSKIGRQTIFLCYYPLPFLHFYSTNYSPQATVKIFLAKKAFPALCQMNRWGVGQRNGWVGGAGMRSIWQCPSGLQRTGSLLGKISSFPKSLIGFLKTPLAMNQRVSITRWFSLRWMVCCIICRHKKIY